MPPAKADQRLRFASDKFPPPLRKWRYVASVMPLGFELLRDSEETLTMKKIILAVMALAVSAGGAFAAIGLGRQIARFNPINGTPGPFTNQIDQNIHAVLVGINYRLGFGSNAVVAKY